MSKRRQGPPRTILRCTFGICPNCGREVMADGWNRLSRDDCYWCGYVGAIPCAPREDGAA